MEVKNELPFKNVGDDRPPLIVILGPTAVGKTDLAIQLAEHLGGEIVSADSRLLYRGMDIGTAKPTLEQRQRIPHHLIDVAGPDEIWSLTLFQREAHNAITDIHTRNQLPLLVGGTGQYIHSIVEAWHIPEIKPNPQLRNALENWSTDIGRGGLHDRLTVIDPEAASNIDYRNLRRTIGALEVIFLSGRLFSAQRQHGTSPYRTIQIGLSIPRPELYSRIDSRIDGMLAAGFIAEVKSLMSKGYAPDLPTFSAIGYQEIIDYLQGKTTLEEAVMIIKRRTRQFVRRQANWFKEDDANIHWFYYKTHPPEIASLLRGRLDYD
jgi:tRNA dimethylallyltransferase